MSGTQERPPWTAFWQDVLKLPVQLLAVGGAVILLVFGLQRLDIFGTISGTAVNGLQVIVALAMFAVGIAVVGFLWWLSSRFFRLLGDKGENADKVAELKDLPMGLPEGTVRAVLALVVAVIGLPLLLFSKLVGDDPAIAGYINGIVTGVFGFYFGTRTTGVPAAAVKEIASAQATALDQTRQANVAREVAAGAEQRADAAQQQATSLQGKVGFDAMLDKAQRHLTLARTVLGIFKGAGALPPGLLPADVDAVFDKADRTVRALQGVTGASATPDQANALQEIVGTLTGGGSPLGALLGKAAPLVAGLAPALGPIGGIAMLLGVGAKLGSGQFKRWRARVLAAPLAQGLVEAGTLTPQLAHAALERTPELQHLLAARPAAEVDAVLANAIVAELPAHDLLAAYGPNGSIAAGLVAEAEAAPAMAKLQQALLALYGAGDVPEERVQQVGAVLAAAPADGGKPLLGLSEAQAAELRKLTPAQVNALIDRVSGTSATAPGEEAAAFDALVTLVDTARRENIDLAQAIAELRA